MYKFEKHNIFSKLVAAVIYFALQLISIETQNFTYKLSSGVQFFVKFFYAPFWIGFNLFAIVMLILTLRARNKIAKDASSMANSLTQETIYEF